jgi:hypothetical protein
MMIIDNSNVYLKIPRRVGFKYSYHTHKINYVSLEVC